MKWFIWTMAAATVACAAPSVVESSGPAENPHGKAGSKAAAMVQVNNVTQAYNQNCANCHGVDGRGGGGGTQSLVTVDKFDQKWDRPFFDAIKNGVPNMGMAAFGGSWDDKSIWSMVVHIRELQLAGLRADGWRPKPDQSGVYRSEHHNYRLEDVMTAGLQTPWSIEWLPDGTMLVANKTGSLVMKRGNRENRVIGTPDTIQLGQGGYMDLAIHPNYRQNGWIYLSYTEPAQGGGSRGLTKVVRGKISTLSNAPRWTNQETIFESDQANYTNAGVHFGSRIVFDAQNRLFFSIGDRGEQNKAQDVTKPNGKIFRLNDNGTAPADNPFAGQSGEAPKVWSYGHRNPQGLVFGLDGRLWNTEHAPRGGDELNEVRRSENYGWPLISFCINYNDTPFGVPWPAQGQNLQLPILRWMPSNAACGLDVVSGNKFPNWNGDLVAGGLAGQVVDRIRVQNGQYVGREELIQGIGRVRDVRVGPDGYIYVALNQPDKIIRLVPVQ